MAIIEQVNYINFDRHFIRFLKIIITKLAVSINSMLRLGYIIKAIEPIESVNAVVKATKELAHHHPTNL